jgi:hypothetical protein
MLRPTPRQFATLLELFARAAAFKRVATKEADLQPKDKFADKIRKPLP